MKRAIVSVAFIVLTVAVWQAVTSTQAVTYLSVRPDPDRVLPAGYVYPLLLKNQPTAAK